MNDNGDGYVKWKYFLPILLSAGAAVLAISLGALEMHAQNPHKDAVRRVEIGDLRDRMKELNRKVDDIHQYLLKKGQ